MDLVKGILSGEVWAIARMITFLERRDPKAYEAMKALYGKCGRAHLVGITGPPGAGKSCLVAMLIRQFRELKRSVGVLAVDPSSPFTGGSILGDRARMEEFANDPGVFIRSLATKGSVGGLAEAVNGAVDIFDAAGKDVILIETVGVGQNEIDIVNLAQTVILVLVPGYGDGLQAMKAGIMEVGDILVVNKADLPGADGVVSELRSMPGRVEAAEVLENPDGLTGNWQVPIARTVATKGEGRSELVTLIDLHREYLKGSNQDVEKNRNRRVNQFLDVLSKRIRTEFTLHYENDPALKGWIKKIEMLQIDPYQASEQVIDFMVEAREEKRKKNRNHR
jgi:LAO/AO transport system kinase